MFPRAVYDVYKKIELIDLRAWLLVGVWLGVDGSDTHDCGFDEKASSIENEGEVQL